MTLRAGRLVAGGASALLALLVVGAAIAALPSVGSGREVPLFVAPWSGRVLATGAASWASVLRGPVAALAFLALVALVADEWARVLAAGRARSQGLLLLGVVQASAAAKEVAYLTGVLTGSGPVLSGEALLHLRVANLATVVQLGALLFVAVLIQREKLVSRLTAASGALFHGRWGLHPGTPRGRVGWVAVGVWVVALVVLR